MKLKLTLTLSLLLLSFALIAQTPFFSLNIVEKDSCVMKSSYEQLKLYRNGKKLKIEFNNAKGRKVRIKLKSKYQLSYSNIFHYRRNGSQLNMLCINKIDNEYAYILLSVDLQNKILSKERIIKRLSNKNCNYSINSNKINNNHLFVHASPNKAGEDEELMILDENYKIQQDLQVNFYDEIERLFREEPREINEFDENIELIETINSKLKEGEVYPESFDRFEIFPIGYNSDFFSFSTCITLKQIGARYSYLSSIGDFENISILNTKTKKIRNFKETNSNEFVELVKSNYLHAPKFMDSILLYTTFNNDTVRKHAYYVNSDIDLKLVLDTIYPLYLAGTSRSRIDLSEATLLELTKTNEFNFIWSSVHTNYHIKNNQSNQPESDVSKFSIQDGDPLIMTDRKIVLHFANFLDENIITKEIATPILKDDLLVKLKPGFSVAPAARSLTSFAPRFIKNNYLQIFDGKNLFIAIPQIKVVYDELQKPKIKYLGYYVYCIDVFTQESVFNKIYFPEKSIIKSSAKLSLDAHGKIFLVHKDLPLVYQLNKIE